MFRLKTVDKRGVRHGSLQTAHGRLETPFFMPDATRGFLKLLDNEAVLATGTKALVVNTFHLYLQPGLGVIKRAGGIHRFMNWNGPLLSDSGGFQVFSLIHKNPKMGKISDEQVVFRSPLDGSRHELSPEKSIQIQFALGVDMMVCLDDCPPNEFSRPDLEAAVDRTIAWAARCRREYDRQIKKRSLRGSRRPLLFAVIQGGAEMDLRERCAKSLAAIGFDGYGFGARPVDLEGNFLEAVLRETARLIPANALRFALGVGTPADIERCSRYGWDMFDCVIPTREGRHGKLFQGNSARPAAININNSRYARDFRPISRSSSLALLRHQGRAYLHHLFRLKDPLGARLASLNNLEYYARLMAGIARPPRRANRAGLTKKD